MTGKASEMIGLLLINTDKIHYYGYHCLLIDVLD